MHDGPDEHGGVPAADPAAWRAEHPAAWRAEHDARERLEAIEDAPLDEHVEVYEDVHRRLQEGLADLDEG